MIERAALAWISAEHDLDGVASDDREVAKGAARAALLAGLDPEDEAMVERVAKHICDERYGPLRNNAKAAWEWERRLYDHIARAAISALKSLAEGDQP